MKLREVSWQYWFALSMILYGAITDELALMVVGSWLWLSQRIADAERVVECRRREEKVTDA